MAVDPTSPIPLYYQVEQELAERIGAGRYETGLAGELDLAVEFGVSRGTVRQALDRLVQNGLIVRHRGRGSFLAPAPLEYPLGRFYRFAQDIADQGLDESSLVIARERIRPPSEIAHQLGISAQTRTVRVVRLRLAGEVPLLLETSYLPEPLARTLFDVDLSHGSLYDHLEREGVRVTEVTEQVRATTLNAGDAARFGLQEAAPAFELERLTVAGSRPVEHRLVLAPTDRITLTARWG